MLFHLSPNTSPDQAHRTSAAPHAFIIPCNFTTRSPFLHIRPYLPLFSCSPCPEMPYRRPEKTSFPSPHINPTYMPLISYQNISSSYQKRIQTSHVSLSRVPLMSSSHILLSWPSLICPSQGFLSYTPLMNTSHISHT